MAAIGKAARSRPKIDRPGLISRTVLGNRRALATAWLRLKRRPVGTLLTSLVIGVTLALPAGLQAVVSTVDAHRDDWEGTFEASLFLKDEVADTRGQALADEIAHRPGIRRAHYMSREQSLQEFRDHSGYGEALDLLKDNPLPAVIVVTPESTQSHQAAEALVHELQGLQEVADVHYDQKGLDRFYAGMAVIERLVDSIAILLAAAVVMIIGNTLRLDVQESRREILVMKQVGASDSFISRPFLFTGLLYGLFGGLTASLMTLGAMNLLTEPAQALFALYGSAAETSAISPILVLAVFATGIALGWISSLASVHRELRAIEPR